MHDLLRIFVSASAILLEGTDEQLDVPGAEKAVASFWSHLRTFPHQVLRTAEELLDEPGSSQVSAHPNEKRWLKAIIDELGAPADRSMMSVDDAWKTVVHAIAWFGFCLKESASYASESDYGMEGFASICDMVERAASEAQTMFVAGVTEAVLQFEAAAVANRRIAEAYDEMMSYAAAV